MLFIDLSRQRDFRDAGRFAEKTLAIARLFPLFSILFAREKLDVTKKDIVRIVSEQLDQTQILTKEVVQKTFDVITDILVSEGRIELRNFGVFEVKHRAARTARNPKTNATVKVDDKYIVKFKPGKEMEAKVQTRAKKKTKKAR